MLFAELQSSMNRIMRRSNPKPCMVRPNQTMSVLVRIIRNAGRGSQRASAREPACDFCDAVIGHALVARESSGQVVRPIPIPGRIEAENYDTNGAGISFYDNTPAIPAAFIAPTTWTLKPPATLVADITIGYVATGEWLNYTLNVSNTAVYQVAFRVASGNGVGNIRVALDGVPLCAVVTPLTGGWQTGRRSPSATS